VLWIDRLQFFDSISDFAPEFYGRVAVLIFEKSDTEANNTQSLSATITDYDFGKATSIILLRHNPPTSPHLSSERPATFQ
jgi:hypothetical protein